MPHNVAQRDVITDLLVKCGQIRSASIVEIDGNPCNVTFFTEFFDDRHATQAKTLFTGVQVKVC